MSNTRNISILLAALIVLCPFRCYASGCCGDVDVEARTCSSCCCGSDTKNPPSDLPADSAPESPEHCPCHDCVCNGALTLNKASDDIASSHLLDFVQYRAMLQSTVSPAQVDQPSFAFPVGASPTHARATLCCWIF